MDRHVFRTLLAAFLLAVPLKLQSATKALPKNHDWRLANVHKVAVVSIQHDPSSNTDAEVRFATELRRQGFDAVASHKLFPGNATYSVKALATRLRELRFNGIMQATHDGGLPKEGLPLRVRFQYHSLRGSTNRLSERKLDLDAAIKALLDGLSK